MDSRGVPVVGDRLRRIDKLAIPPAWRDVWISPSPNAKLQATGVDAAGRRQYLYHPEYRAAREQAKYDRLVRFGELLPDLRRTLDRHLQLGPYEEEWACAIAVTLVNRAWFRVGSERHVRTGRTYGITTLSKRHVAVRGRRVSFRFPGKHRIAVRTTVVDPDIAEAVRKLLLYDGGARLLRFDRAGEPANLTARLLNDYIAEHLGDGFTAKDFRTWGGTLSAARGLADRGLAETSADERRILAAVMRRVGAELGNTPSVARASYVSPAVVEQWRDGRTLDDFARRKKRGLSPDETALLSLLRSWRIRRASGRPAR